MVVTKHNKRRIALAYLGVESFHGIGERKIRNMRRRKWMNIFSMQWINPGKN
jgi:hypothetical protein